MSDAKPLVFPAVKSWRQATLPSPFHIDNLFSPCSSPASYQYHKCSTIDGTTQPLSLGCCFICIRHCLCITAAQRHVPVKSPAELTSAFTFAMLRQSGTAFEICGLLTRRFVRVPLYPFCSPLIEMLLLDLLKILARNLDHAGNG